MRKLLTVLTLIASSAGAQMQIGTYTPPTVPTKVGAVGPFGSVSVGQAFVAPAGATSLTSLTYSLFLAAGNAGGGPSSLSVFAFNGSVPSLGSALFTQAFTNPTTPGTPSLSFSPNIPVVGGTRYIALVSTTVSNSNQEALLYEIADSPANTTGDVLYLCITGQTTCSVRDPGRVAAFQAAFVTASTVPEPSTLVLGATGLLALAFARKRRVS